MSRSRHHPWLFILFVLAFVGAAAHGDVVVGVVSLVAAMWLVGRC